MKQVLHLLLISLFLITSCGKKNEPEPNTNPTTNEKKAKACFSMDEDQPEEGEDVKFDAFCSENAEFYYWYVDGQAVESDSYKELNLTRSFNRGDHSVTLRVTGEHGKDSVTKEFNVKYTPPPGPEACFTISPNNADLRYPVNSTLEFNGYCSKNYDPITGFWILGSREEDRKEGMTASKTFNTKGTYNISFSVHDPSRLSSDGVSKTIEIY